MKQQKWSDSTLITFIGILVAIIILLSLGVELSVASGGDKTVTKGYEGSERVRLVEKPVTPNSETTTTKGYIGDKRVNLKTSKGKTKGWIGGEYSRTKSTSIGDSDGS